MIHPRFTRILGTLLLLIQVNAGSVSAGVYYVATNGSNSNPGTLALPWQTIQHAANKLHPGDTVYVRGGIYKEAVTVNVTGSNEVDGRITFVNYPGEVPIVDGTGLAPPADGSYTGLFYLNNCNCITIDGFELCNYGTASIVPTPAGIFISGSSSYILIKDCNIRNITSTGGGPANSGNAFALGVYGTSATPCTGIVISHNSIHNCKTGSSETVSLNGNVTNFQVIDNLIYDNNNIGLDFIGFEGVCPDPAQDQARGGICEGNTIWNTSSQGNQAYPEGDYSADGFYVDGGTDITIEGNISYNNDIGVELASENAGKATSLITLRNNMVYSNRTGGLFMGGYSAEGTGGTEGCTIVNNTFWNNDTLQWGNGEMQLRWRTSGCVIRQNILFAGAVNTLVTIPVAAANNVNNTFNDNVYYSAAGSGGAQWIWNNVGLTGFAAWKATSRQDAQSIFANPQFISTGANPDLDLQSSSPAIPLGAGSDVPMN
jgi:hypothetical protein